jgi:sugar transferase (PEP-CTERM system associated)
VRVFRHYLPGISLTWLAGDATVILLVYWAAEQSAPDPSGFTLASAVWLAAVTVFVLHVGDMYNIRLTMGRREVIARILLCQLVCAILIAAAGFVVPVLQLDRSSYFTVVGGGALGLIIWRLGWLGPWSSFRAGRVTLVLGVGRIAQSIAELEGSSARPFRIAGFVDDDPDAAASLPSGHRLLGRPDQIQQIVDEVKPDLIVVAQSDRRGAFPAAALLECRLRGISVEEWPAFYEKVTGKILVSDMRPSWLIFSDGFVKTRPAIIIKRALDVTLSLAGMIVASPLIAATALAVRLESTGPVLFRQTRVGQFGRPFSIYKFRSMRVDAEGLSGPVWAQKDDPRVTRIGTFLRRSRLDELPQLYNVLVGDMSFIGPRPERPEFIEELERRIPFYRARLSVKPGVTGWAQVRYTYGASVEETLEKLQYDLYYVKNLSLFLDLLILISTVQVVIFGRGR